MNYTSYFLAFQLCILLGSSGCYCDYMFLKEVEELKEYFNATNPDVANDGFLFLGILNKNWTKESDRAIFLSQIVSFYLKLFHLYGNETINSTIETLKEDLIVKFFNSDSSEKFDDFRKLMNLQITDKKVQTKAVSEFKRVIDEISPRSALSKRKRSQRLFLSRRAVL
ncbi:interferon gamma [Ctenodactylus gundi]